MSRPEPEVFAEFFTTAATPDQEVAVVFHYGGHKSKSATMTPAQARDFGVQIIAAAARAELPPREHVNRLRFPTHPEDRSGPEWYDKHSEEL